MSYTDDLDNYKSYPTTDSCYLDGRYFNLVFRNYPGLITEPLYIWIWKDDNTIKMDSALGRTDIDNRYPGLLRVIIETPEGRHSNLLIISYKEKRIFRYEPFGRSYPYFEEVNNIIQKHLRRFLDFQLFIIDEPAHQRKNPLCEAEGLEGGFCTAYIIKYAYDYLNDRKFDQSEILRFASLVESMYEPLPEKGKDIEYGPNDQGRNALLGGLGGAAIGSVVAGPAGLLLGGLAGGAIGSTL